MLDLTKLDEGVSEPSFVDCVAVGSLYSVLRNIPVKEYDKPTYVGILTLDYSKLLMTKFWFFNIQPHGYQLLYQVTDSFVFVGPQPYKEREHMESGRPELDVFDVSNLKADWVTDEIKNRGVKQLCRMKTEIGDLEMTKFVALRPKAYAYKLSDGKVEARVKGVARAVRNRFNVAEREGLS